MVSGGSRRFSETKVSWFFAMVFCCRFAHCLGASPFVRVCASVANSEFLHFLSSLYQNVLCSYSFSRHMNVVQYARQPYSGFLGLADGMNHESCKQRLGDLCGLPEAHGRCKGHFRIQASSDMYASLHYQRLRSKGGSLGTETASFQWASILCDHALSNSRNGCMLLVTCYMGCASTAPQHVQPRANRALDVQGILPNSS